MYCLIHVWSYIQYYNSYGKKYTGKKIQALTPKWKKVVVSKWWDYKWPFTWYFNFLKLTISYIFLKQIFFNLLLWTDLRNQSQSHQKVLIASDIMNFFYPTHFEIHYILKIREIQIWLIYLLALTLNKFGPFLLINCPFKGQFILTEGILCGIYYVSC